MNYDVLEQLRKQKLFHFFIWSILSFIFGVLAMIFIFWFVHALSTSEQKTTRSHRGTSIVLLPAIITGLIAGDISKSFEAIIKNNMINDIVRNIANCDTIKWHHQDEKPLSFFSIIKDIFSIISIEKNNSNNTIITDVENSMLPKELFNQYAITDDSFSGTYKNIPFYAWEVNDVFFRGVIFKIGTNNKNSLKTVITPHGILMAQYQKDLSKNLQKIKTSNFSHNIYIDKINNIENILTDELRTLLATKYKKYSMVFMGENIYFLMPTNRDLFKIGSLFKNIYDEKQYTKFQKDLCEVLDCIETIGNIINRS